MTPAPLTPATALLLGAIPRSELRDEIACGRHPRVEYLEFLDRYPMPQVDFRTVTAWRPPGIRHVGPYGRLPLWLRGPGRGLRRVLLTGEDIGVPTALVQRFSGGRSELYTITHGSFLNSARARRVLGLAARYRRARYLCLSTSIAGHLTDGLGIDPVRVVTVGYGVDTDFFQPVSAPPSTSPIIASAGTASRDYRTLVQAVAEVDVRVRIAADSEWFPATVDISGVELPGHVQAHSYGDYEQLRALYGAAAFVVVPLYPGRHAAGYAVMAEAMAMGKAVVASRTASPPDFLVDGETGLLVPTGDAGALKAGIQRLLADPAEAAAMGARGRLRIAQHYTIDRYVDRLAAAMDLA